MRISDWSSDVCSSDLLALHHQSGGAVQDGAALIRQRGAAAIGPMGGLDHLSHLARARARNRREGRQVVLVQDGQALALARHPAAIDQQRMLEIGRASCRERVCTYV